MASDWYIEGPYVKSCSCDPGCPCDFNQRPTHGVCEGIAAMRIDRGHFDDVDLSGLAWGVVYHWPGPLWEGEGHIQAVLDPRADVRQADAILEILSGKHGGTFFQVIDFIAPHKHEPVTAPIEFEVDLDSRSGHVRLGDAATAEVETLRGIDPPDPYRILVRIPGGMEYTGESNEAEIALSKTLQGSGEITFDCTDSHTSLAYVRHGPDVETFEATPTVKTG